MRKEESYDIICRALPEEIARALLWVPDEVRHNCHEIRLRVHQPLGLFDGERNLFISKEGALCLPEKGMHLSPELLREALIKLCGYSLHSYVREMEHGYFTTKEGYRIGICLDRPDGGAAIQPVSLNIRLTREVLGAADKVMEIWQERGGLILAGPPASGKTTLLRDLVRLVSAGSGNFPPQKAVLLDERREVSALSHGVSPFSLGPCTDILPALPKREAIQQAVRALSPQVIFCDEIASPEEIEQIRYAFACGIAFVVTVHCGGEEELFRNEMMARLMTTGAFSQIILLQSPRLGEQIKAVITDAQYNLQSSGTSDDLRVLHSGRISYGKESVSQAGGPRSDDPILEGIFPHAETKQGDTAGATAKPWKKS